MYILPSMAIGVLSACLWAWGEHKITNFDLLMVERCPRRPRRNVLHSWAKFTPNTGNDPITIHNQIFLCTEIKLTCNAGRAAFRSLNRHRTSSTRLLRCSVRSDDRSAHNQRGPGCQNMIAPGPNLRGNPFRIFVNPINAGRPCATQSWEHIARRLRKV